MLFNSIQFLFFFPIVTILFFVLPHKFRWILLLSASCFFYSFFIPVYIFILIFTIIIDYSAGILIEKSSKYKKFWLILSLAANIGILGFFKYTNFLITNVNDLLLTDIALMSIILPIGLSFHTFQAMSYTIEIYRGNFKAEKHLGIFALYVMFYPQLVAGPIERPQHMLPQFRKVQHFSFQNLLDGLRLMLMGYFKKVVIADRISGYVAAIFDKPDGYHPLNICIGIFFFSIQIYCDFSGYSDIAIGSAKTMGFDLMINFNRPYGSLNIREFWKRWHISLSSWFKDYVFIPLGGSYHGVKRTIINILIVFILSGLWHGANWTFVIWGALHGLALVLFTLFKIKPSKINIYQQFLSWLTTYIFVVFAWVFFRSSSIENAITIYQSIFKTDSDKSVVFSFSYNNFSYGNMNLIFSFLCICALFLFERFTQPKLTDLNKFVFRDIAFCVIMIILIVLFGVYNRESFIYFQF